eukprot:CAMPEP_0194350870 /NCGR_PEP_ID=MMETSP0171-20130528/107873_1 /TAXON_ID=218684 /ORGANISM="Corethron pennatum, Strain L29A3" /LENGTH=201 /DNA_ID=CAMNT_0039118453 /DNA_START=71 /DNA_END=678 /DNA_ORIENTATION=-
MNAGLYIIVGVGCRVEAANECAVAMGRETTSQSDNFPSLPSTLPVVEAWAALGKVGVVDAPRGGGGERLTVNGSRGLAALLLDGNYLQLYNLEEDKESDDDKSNDKESEGGGAMTKRTRTRSDIRTPGRKTRTMDGQHDGLCRYLSSGKRQGLRIFCTGHNDRVPQLVGKRGVPCVPSSTHVDRTEIFPGTCNTQRPPTPV